MEHFGTSAEFELILERELELEDDENVSFGVQFLKSLLKSIFCLEKCYYSTK